MPPFGGSHFTMKAVEARGLNGTQNRKKSEETDLFRLELKENALEAAPLKVFNDAHMLHPDLKKSFSDKKIAYMAIDLDETLVVYGDKAQEATYFCALLHCFVRPSSLNESEKEDFSHELWELVEEIHHFGQYHRLAPETYNLLAEKGLMADVLDYKHMDALITPVRTELVVPSLLEAGYLRRADGANRLLCALLLEGIVGRILTMTPREPALRYVEQLIDSDVGKPCFHGSGATFGDAVEKKKPELFALEYWCAQNQARKEHTAVIDDTFAFIENCLHGGVGVAIWRMTPKAEINASLRARAEALQQRFGDRLVIIRTLDELTVKA